MGCATISPASLDMPTVLTLAMSSGNCLRPCRCAWWSSYSGASYPCCNPLRASPIRGPCCLWPPHGGHLHAHHGQPGKGPDSPHLLCPLS